MLYPLSYEGGTSAVGSASYSPLEVVPHAMPSEIEHFRPKLR